MRYVWWMIAIVTACAGPPRRPDRGDAEPSHESQLPPAERTVLRFLRDEQSMLRVTAEQKVFRGEEQVASFDREGRLFGPDGVLVARIPAEGPVRGTDDSELPFLIEADGTMWVEGQRRPGRFDENGNLVYPAVPDLRVRLVGELDAYRPMAMLLILYQSGFLTQDFQDSVRRAKAREAEQGLQELAGLLQAYLSEHRTFSALPLGPTPEPGCDTRPWPEDAPEGWATLGFRKNPARYSFSIERQGRDYVLSAQGDLDCDEQRSTFRLTLTRDRDGSLVQRGDIDKVEPLE